MRECAIGPDYYEDLDEIPRQMESAKNIFSGALRLLIPTDLVKILLLPQYSYIWVNCLNPLSELLDEILFIASFGKKGKISKAHSCLSIDTLQWQFMWMRKVFRQVKNPIPGNIRNFLRQAKKIANSLQKTRSVKIADKETYQTLIAFLQIALKYE